MTTDTGLSEAVAKIILASNPPKGRAHRGPNALAKANTIIALIEAAHIEGPRPTEAQATRSSEGCDHPTPQDGLESSGGFSQPTEAGEWVTVPRDVAEDAADHLRWTSADLQTEGAIDLATEMYRVAVALDAAAPLPPESPKVSAEDLAWLRRLRLPDRLAKKWGEEVKNAHIDRLLAALGEGS